LEFPFLEIAGISHRGLSPEGFVALQSLERTQLTNLENKTHEVRLFPKRHHLDGCQLRFAGNRLHSIID